MRKLKVNARRADPETSWDAAKSVDPQGLVQAQRDIYKILCARGPLTDEEIYDLYCMNDLRPISESGARTRRSELVTMGMVRDSGQRGVTASGRKTIRWEVVTHEEEGDRLRARTDREDKNPRRQGVGRGSGGRRIRVRRHGES